MKKFGIVFCLIFAFLLTFNFGLQTIPVSAASENEGALVTKVSSASQFNMITGSGKYVLDADISFESTPLVPIQNFTGTLDGNGHKLVNIKFEGSAVVPTPPGGGDIPDEPDEPDEPGSGAAPAAVAPTTETQSFAIFINTSGATIKNLIVKDFTVDINQSSETESLKVATIVANAEQNTVIENCTVMSSKDKANNINITSKSRTYIGGLVADAKSGTQIKNCTVQQNITFKNLSTTRTNYVGGVVGYLEDSKLSFVVQNSTITLDSVMSNESYIGGMVGYAIGTFTKMKNSVIANTISAKTECAHNIQVGSVIGYVPFVTNMLSNSGVGYIYTTEQGDYIGNANELKLYYDQGVSSFNVAAKILATQTKDMMTSKSFYMTSSNNFDPEEKWDFVGTWQIEQEKITLPSLQRFSSFEYKVNVDESFTESGLTKPVLPLQSNIITITYNQDSKYEYGQALEVGGYVTAENHLDKFFNISGIRKDGVVLFKNQSVLEILENPNTTIEEGGDGSKVYTLSKNKVVTEYIGVEVKGTQGIKYVLKDSNVEWYRYSTGESMESLNASLYVINGCDLSDSGDYNFVLEPIKYEINVLTDNVTNGTVKRTTGNITYESFVDEVSYGQFVSYTAVTSTSDFGFNSWYNADKTVELANQSKLEFAFNEKQFAEGGLFSGLLPDNKLVFVATFTKRVCDITVKFALKNEIISDLLSSVTIDGENPEKDGVIFKKVAMDKSYYVEVVLPAGYKFLNWY
ncbi:MAG: hypothetical protein J6Q51_00005, partial [Clostridia bacterium]|nr:hypothetical protein [Clostridia bacterium]